MWVSVDSDEEFVVWVISFDSVDNFELGSTLISEDDFDVDDSSRGLESVTWLE
jgi:hypothetical protein